MRSTSNGLVRKSIAPSLIASTAVSTGASPLITTTRHSGSVERIVFRTSIPPTPGMYTSTNARCAFRDSRNSSASRPPPHGRTSKPARSAM